MNGFSRGLVFVLLAMGCLAATAKDDPAAKQDVEPRLRFQSLPDLPDPIGVAGPVVGVQGEFLIVAGGANFAAPDDPVLWDVPKQYHDRACFDDAMDFMGWFIYKTHKINGVSKWDARNQYLNYHEGWGGYKRKTYNQKPWLIKVAARVDERSKRYAAQYRQCQEDLDSSWLWRLFFG